MKKFINISIIYTIIGLVLGVYYREVTKYTDFYSNAGAKTQLAVTHTHTLVLGVIFVLLMGLLVTNKKRSFSDVKLSMILYISGFTLTLIMMIVRGNIQVFNPEMLSKGIDSMISGISGLGHIILAGGFIHFLIDLKKIYKE